LRLAPDVVGSSFDDDPANPVGIGMPDTIFLNMVFSHRMA
jgi:hypothetical protein